MEKKEEWRSVWDRRRGKEGDASRARERRERELNEPFRVQDCDFRAGRERVVVSYGVESS